MTHYLTPEIIDTLAAFGAAIILAVLVLALIWKCSRLDEQLAKAERERARAEAACESLRQSVMKGSAVGRWHNVHRAANADEWYHHVLTAEGPLLLTDEAWQVARQRAAKLLK